MDGLARLLTHAERRPAGWPLAAALTLLGASVCVLCDPEVGLLAKTLAEPIAHSTSPGAALIVLIGAALGLLVIDLDRRRAFAPSIIGAAAIGLPLALLVGNGANLAAHLAALHELGLPLTMPVYHWAGDSNTYSYWLHTHAGKAALAGLGSALGPRGYDVGAALAGTMPAWAAPLCLASLVIASVCALPLLAAWARRSSTPWPALLFFVASLNAIKTIADGGPLSYRFAPCFAVCLVMLACLRPPRSAGRRAGLAAAALVGLGSLGAMISGITLDCREAAISLACLLGLLAWLAIPPTATGLLRPARVCAAVLTLLGWTVAVLDTPVALWLPLPQDTLATVCTHDHLRCSTRSVAGESAADVYRAGGDDPLKPRFTLLHRHVDIGPTRLGAVVRPLRTGPVSITGADAAVAVQPLRPVADERVVLVELRADHLPRIFGDTPGPYSARNYQVFLHLAAARLRGQGLAAFVLAPIRNPADAGRLGLL